MGTLKSRIIRSLKEYRKYLPAEAIPVEKMHHISPQDEWIAEEAKEKKQQFVLYEIYHINILEGISYFRHLSINDQNCI